MQLYARMLVYKFLSVKFGRRAEYLIYLLHLLRGEKFAAKRMYESEFGSGVANPAAERAGMDAVFGCELFE